MTSLNKSVYDALINTSLNDVFQAAKDLAPIIKKTELMESPYFSKECNNQVYLKPENLQITGAFKIRGAFNKINKLTTTEKDRGVIAASAGNHAQGVAYASKLLGVNATIVMPATTPIIKVEATKEHGATVVLFGDSYDDAYNKALTLAQEHNYVFIHPFDDLDVIIGQGTIAIEILDELADAHAILVPIGGGCLASGVDLAAKHINPNIKIIGVEPDGAACMKYSLAKNKVSTLDYVDTVADGTAVKTPGELTFSFIRQYVDEVITVSDFDIMATILLLIEKHKLISEGAGVLALAGLKKLNFHNKKVVSIISGGNIDISTISAIINKALVVRGRVFCFSVNLPDKPGQLLKVAEILASQSANVINLNHNQAKVTNSYKQVELEVTVETNGDEHIEQITTALEQHNFIIQKIY